VPLPGTVDLVAKGMIGWRYAFGTVTPTTGLSFASGGSPFIVAGVPIAKNAAVVEAGLDGHISDAETLGVTYSGELSSGAQDHAIKVSYIRRY
jgi:uncharacterized protein with beta-barrel porin domain